MYKAKAHHWMHLWNVTGGARPSAVFWPKTPPSEPFFRSCSSLFAEISLSLLPALPKQSVEFNHWNVLELYGLNIIKQILNNHIKMYEYTAISLKWVGQPPTSSTTCCCDLQAEDGDSCQQAGAWVPKSEGSGTRLWDNRSALNCSFQTFVLFWRYRSPYLGSRTVCNMI